MFFKFHREYSKRFNAQHCLLLIIEKWHEVLDNGAEIGPVLTDLSKTFDCINHNLLIAKLIRTVMRKVYFI